MMQRLLDGIVLTRWRRTLQPGNANKDNCEETDDCKSEKKDPFKWLNDTLGGTPASGGN